MIATVFIAMQASHPAGQGASSGVIQLVSAVSSIKAGQPFDVGIRLEPAQGWHTYWMNPGDSGGPTSVEWHLPKGWVKGPIEWPAPERIETSGIVSYGYEKPAMLVETITPPATLPSKGTVELKGRVKWLTCTPEMCRPADGDFHLKLAITAGTPVENPQWHDKIAEEASLIPRPLVADGLQARIEGKEIVLTITAQGPLFDKPGKPYFFPDSPGMVSHSMPQSYSFTATGMVARLPISEYTTKPPTRLAGVLKAPPGDEFAGQGAAVTINVPISNSQEKKS